MPRQLLGRAAASSDEEPLEAGTGERYARLEHLPYGRVALRTCLLQLRRRREDQHTRSGSGDHRRVSLSAKDIQQGHRVREGWASLFLVQPLTGGRQEQVRWRGY